MAFSPVGLGGTAAAGFLTGVASAVDRREKERLDREKSYLEMYSKLIQSGEWMPVDMTKGVQDGGVLKVGNIGMLQRREPQVSAQDLLRLAQTKYYTAKATEAEKPKTVQVGTIKTIDVPLEDEDGTIVPGKQSLKWDGEKWESMGDPAPVQGGNWHTWIDSTTGKPLNIQAGRKPPKEYMEGNIFNLGATAQRFTARTQMDILDSNVAALRKNIDRLETIANLPPASEDPNDPINKARRQRDRMLQELDQLEGQREQLLSTHPGQLKFGPKPPPLEGRSRPQAPTPPIAPAVPSLPERLIEGAGEVAEDVVGGAKAIYRDTAKWLGMSADELLERVDKYLEERIRERQKVRKKIKPRVSAPIPKR